MSLLDKIKNFTVKENHFYYFTFFWAYGIFGAGTESASELSIFYIFFPILIILIIFFFNKKNETIFELNEVISNLVKEKNYIYFILIFIFLFFLSWEKITLSITDDENAYVGLGLVHSNILIDKILINFKLISNYTVGDTIHFISLSIVISSLIFFYTLNLFSEKKLIQVIILCLTVLFLRILINNFGGNEFPHPPFIALPALFSVSLFGVSDLTFKLSHFVIFNLFVFYIFLNFKKEHGSILSLIITLSLFSIPGILYLGISYEQALWTMICYTLILFETNKNIINYKRIFIIILFFSFFRILSLISLSIIFFFILFKSKSLREFYKETIFVMKSSYPLIIILPFICFSFLERSSITVNRIGLEFLEYNFISYNLPKMIFNSYYFYAGSLIFLILLLSLIYIKNFKLMLSFLIILIIVYSNVITGNSKYLYEIFFPVLIFLSFFLNFHFKKTFSKKLFISLIIFLLPLNILLLKNFKNICITKENPFNDNHFYDVRFGCWFHDNHPFNIKKAYNFLNNNNDFSFKNLYVPGVYYGLLPSIINGMKLKDFKEHKSINQNQNLLNLKNDINWITADSALINSDPKIKYVLLADMTNKFKLEKDLINSGWNKIYEDVNKSYLTKIIVLHKDN
ncbi:hypothetical protein N9T20_00450 [bacterium]|nr:hypothetical protein [bacterium]